MMMTRCISPVNCYFYITCFDLLISACGQVVLVKMLQFGIYVCGIFMSHSIVIAILGAFFSVMRNLACDRYWLLSLGSLGSQVAFALLHISEIYLRSCVFVQHQFFYSMVALQV